MSGETDLAPVLQTDRLLLREHRREDFPHSAAMWADPQVVARISGAPSSEEESWSRFLRYAGHWRHLGYGYWVVRRRSDGAFLGEVGFANYRRDTDPDLQGNPEAGWVLVASAHGQGYATEAVTAMLGWADATLDYPHTFAMFDPTHQASIAVAKKVGYAHEVTGRYRDRDALFMQRARRAL
ncbi:MAG: GNAT family N-acetyltransferase [Marivibrio sp.]|uniref:GNAT family N-acetyltransferase n=1 Tax=Marivibrio sp. TaxID=2039719 RepID=UPI0032EB26BA